MLRIGKTIRLSSNVLEAMKFTAKVGHINREFWYRHFCQGNTRWQIRQFSNFVSHEYFVKHQNPSTNMSYVLSEKSKIILRAMGVPFVLPSPANHLYHDGLVGSTMYGLYKNGICLEWFNERELYRDKDRHFLILKVNDSYKYPDAVFKVHAYGEIKTIALEYERTCKSSKRYRDILRKYASLKNISMILYVCENEATQKIIQMTAEKICNADLISRLAFVNAKAWQENAMTADIYIRKTRLRLCDVCTNENRIQLAG